MSRANSGLVSKVAYVCSLGEDFTLVIVINHWAESVRSRRGWDMVSTLRVIEMRLRTDHGWQPPYKMDSDVVIVHGPVDRGKTSLLDAIAFAFGRDVRFRGAVHEYLREVEITIRIGASTYTLSRRHWHRSKVKVTDTAGTLIGHLSVRRSPGESTLSDWLLAELGLGDAIASIYVPGGRALDFASAILPYTYLCQDDIDRFLVMPPAMDPVRVAVMRLLFHLTTPQVERAAGTIKDGEKEIKRRRDRAQVIEEFLADSKTTTLENLDAEITALTTRESEAAARLADLRKTAHAAESLDQHLAERIRTAHGRWRVAEDKLDKLRRKLERAERDVDGFQAALDELAELQAREPSPLTLREVIANCPICLGVVPRQPPTPGHCYLCGGLHPGTVQPAELTALKQSLAAAQTVRDALAAQVFDAAEAAQRAELDVSGLRHEREVATGPDVQPYIGAIQSVSAEHARINAELRAKQADRARILPLETLREEIAELAAEQTRRSAELHDLRTDLISPANLLQHLRGVLRNILRRIELPHFTGRIRIDPDSLLPVIDGLDFDQRGGGARSAVSIAYSLALLAVTQEDSGSLLPTLLMIDSPRKNFGASDTDRALADRIYSNLLEYVVTWSGSRVGIRETSFQIIIADNDRNVAQQRKKTVPKALRGHIAYVDLDEEGLIRGLIDPHRGLGKKEEEGEGAISEEAEDLDSAEFDADGFLGLQDSSGERIEDAAHRQHGDDDSDKRLF